MFINHYFEENQNSRTATGIYEIGHESIKLMKWICYYERSHYEFISYYNYLGSGLICFKSDTLSKSFQIN